MLPPPSSHPKKTDSSVPNKPKDGDFSLSVKTDETSRSDPSFKTRVVYPSPDPIPVVPIVLHSDHTISSQPSLSFPKI
jgi:hypothetical protein